MQPTRRILLAIATALGFTACVDDPTLEASDGNAALGCPDHTRLAGAVLGNASGVACYSVVPIDEHTRAMQVTIEAGAGSFDVYAMPTIASLVPYWRQINAAPVDGRLDLLLDHGYWSVAVVRRDWSGTFDIS